jgi:predicted Zn-dependent protease
MPKQVLLISAGIPSLSVYYWPIWAEGVEAAANNYNLLAMQLIITTLVAAALFILAVRLNKKKAAAQAAILERGESGTPVSPQGNATAKKGNGLWAAGAITACVAATAVFALLALSPDNMGAMMMQAMDERGQMLQLAKENAQHTIDTFSDSMSISAQACDVVARAYDTLGDTENVIKTLNKGIDRFPEEPSFYINLANVYASKGDKAKERETLEDGWANTGADSIKQRLDELNGQ